MKQLIKIDSNFLSRELATEISVEKCKLFKDSFFDISFLNVQPFTNIYEHHHLEDCEAYFDIVSSELSFCQMGNSHSYHNMEDDRSKGIISIKSKLDLSISSFNVKPNINDPDFKEIIIFKNDNYKISLLKISPYRCLYDETTSFNSNIYFNISSKTLEIYSKDEVCLLKNEEGTTKYIISIKTQCHINEEDLISMIYDELNTKE